MRFLAETWGSLGIRNGDGDGKFGLFCFGIARIFCRLAFKVEGDGLFDIGDGFF